MQLFYLKNSDFINAENQIIFLCLFIFEVSDNFLFSNKMFSEKNFNYISLFKGIQIYMFKGIQIYMTISKEKKS